MKNQEFSKKVKDLRNRNGISQDDLAQKTNLNLRTIQRIEAGDTAPRGDTLKRLALALNVQVDDLITWEEQENRSLHVIIQLSTLTFVVFPLLGVIVPFIIWILKRERVRGLDSIGKKVINFQITFCLAFLVFYAYIFCKILHVNLPLPNIAFRVETIVVGVLVYYGYNIMLVVINAVRSFKNLKVYYPLSLRLLR